MKNMMTVIFWIAVVYLSLAGAMFMAQRDFMYFPSHMKPSVDDSGIIGLEEIAVTTSDGLNLFGWFKRPDIETMPVIVWFHGNASNVGWSAARAKTYMKEGYGALFVEYRGYAGNPGTPTEDGFYSDARAFITWLKGQGYDENHIILYGESIGSGPAVKMALEYPSIHALILEAPFTSTVDVASRMYPFIPVGWLIKDRYESIERIGALQSRLIVAHGDSDTIIPYTLGQKLFNAAPEPKTFLSIGGGGHNNLDEFDLSGRVLAALNEAKANP